MSIRLRRLTAAAAASLALIAVAPGSARAAAGEFRYTYNDGFGGRIAGMLVDPDSRTCVPLPEVAGPGTEPAFAPQNVTDSTVVMFAGFHCDGDHYSLRPGGRATDRLKLRSVLFS